MKTKRIDAFLTGIPAWALASLTIIGITFLMFALPDWWFEDKTSEAIAYVFLGIVNAIFCYFIVKRFPNSFWYVPVIINAMYIISVFAENYGLRDWLFIGGIWTLSIIGSCIGTWKGKKNISVKR